MARVDTFVTRQRRPARACALSDGRSRFPDTGLPSVRSYTPSGRILLERCGWLPSGFTLDHLDLVIVLDLETSIEKQVIGADTARISSIYILKAPSVT
jgi:hypothetical protein